VNCSLLRKYIPQRYAQTSVRILDLGPRCRLPLPLPTHNTVSEQQERYNIFSQGSQMSRTHLTAHLICIMYRTARHSVLYTLHCTSAKRLMFDITQTNCRLLTPHAFRAKNTTKSTSQSNRTSSPDRSATYATETCILIIEVQASTTFLMHL
jgi:hypothetical protein